MVGQYVNKYHILLLGGTALQYSIVKATMVPGTVLQAQLITVCVSTVLYFGFIYSPGYCDVCVLFDL